MWCSLELVSLLGDIAKQMPADAKKFAKIDKDWQKILGNPGLLMILSQGSDPLSMNEHYLMPSRTWTTARRTKPSSRYAGEACGD